MKQVVVNAFCLGDKVFSRKPVKPVREEAPLLQAQGYRPSLAQL
jgi:hypothetical protein